MEDFVLELTEAVSWSENGLEDEILYGSGAGPDGFPLMISRMPPDLLYGSAGVLWLASGKRIVRLEKNQTAEVFSLDAADIDRCIDIIPSDDKGLLILGSKGEHSVLVRLTVKGSAVWRQDDLSLSPENTKPVQLIADDESVYLYAVGSKTAQVISVNPENGELTDVYQFQGSLPQKIWIQKKCIFWVVYAEGKFTLESYALDTGQRNSISPQGDLQRVFASICTVLPNGDVLLAIPQNNELIWMNTHGLEKQRLKIAGIVRNENRLVVAILKQDNIFIEQWIDGKVVESVRMDAFSTRMDLIYFDQNAFYFSDTERIFKIDSTGKKIGEVPFLEVGTQRKQREGVIAISKAVATPDGSLLIPGTDAKGVFVVRIGFN